MCRSGCRTQDHKTWGECARAANLRVAYCRSAAGMDATKQKAWDNELQAYRDARAEGIQPEGTTMGKITAAKAISDKTGVAFTPEMRAVGAGAV